MTNVTVLEVETLPDIYLLSPSSSVHKQLSINSQTYIRYLKRGENVLGSQPVELETGF